MLDEFLGSYEFSEHHEIVVDADEGAVYGALMEIDMRDSPFIAPLLWIRTLPARLLGRRPDDAGSDLTMKAFSAGFQELRRDPPRLWVLGSVGRFWQADGGIIRMDPDAFASFTEPGVAKLVMGFWTLPHGDRQTLLITETRVACTDADARRRFWRYWVLIRPFSGLIRREMLRLAKRGAARQ